MNKKRIFQGFAIVIVSGTLLGMLVVTDVYDRVHEGIVEVLCLSCLKLDPKTSVTYTFDTANNESHSPFVLSNITEGIVFLHFSEDACPGCDIMLPIIQDLFSVRFEKDEMFDTTLQFNNNSMTYIYTNIDHASQYRIDALEIYDQRNIKGLPMFTIVTLGYDKGDIKPYYSSLYGTLGLDSDHARHIFLESVIKESMAIWIENRPGYNPGQLDIILKVKILTYLL